jgi:4-amino-4-deoxy-L-arabinose transferase-like glycosyltransferase
LLLPFAQIDDSDAVARIFSGISWKENPEWIYSNFWCPFHFYLIGLGFFIWNDPVYMPMVVHIVFSVLTLVPFYFLVKREFNENGAFIATIFLAICPILFRNSFLALSETPYLFFLILSLNYLSKGLRNNSYMYMILSGLSITIASGFRYEAWIMIFVICLIICLVKRWKYLLAFIVPALLFPISWLYTNWIATGNPFYGIHGNYYWTIVEMGNNDNLHFSNYLRRIWFFPFSWIIAVGIPAAIVIIQTIWKIFTGRPLQKNRLIQLLPFLVMFLVMQYNAFKGVLLLQHRFIGTLVILSLPFVSDYFKEYSPKKIRLAWLFGITTIALSFVYNTTTIKPVPRLQNQAFVGISEIINKNISPKSYLVIDNVGWNNTFYLALHSRLPQTNTVLTGDAKNSYFPIKEIRQKLYGQNEGVLLLKKNSEIYNTLYQNDLRSACNRKLIKEIYSDDKILILKQYFPEK